MVTSANTLMVSVLRPYEGWDDYFRGRIEQAIEAYHEVARRLGIIQLNEQPERSKPKLVKSDQ